MPLGVCGPGRLSYGDTSRTERRQAFGEFGEAVSLQGLESLMADRMLYSHVPPGTHLPDVVHAIIEIPKGRRSKFEVDKRTGLIRLDRYLYSSSHYPGDYGFIPQTLAEDGDALDILVMVNEPTFSGCLIETRVVGLFRMVDRGANDYKVLGVPNTDPLFAEYQDLEDVANHFLREVEHFFATYKQLEGAVVEPQGWESAAKATEEVRASVARYHQQHQQAMLDSLGGLPSADRKR